MFTVICVYNRDEVLHRVLLPSLDAQRMPHERILLDNREGRFPSAAAALNHAAREARGEFLLFIHQDAALPDSGWLEAAQAHLATVPRLGVAGCAGMAEEGLANRDRGRGQVTTRGRRWAWSRTVAAPEPVVTLDECLLIARRDLILDLPFDEATFDGWHLYGADLCLRARERGLQVVVLPLPLVHESDGNPIAILTYQWRLARKFRGRVARIPTTTGTIPTDPLPWLLRREILSLLAFRYGYRRRL